MNAENLTLEGTWEEIAAHADELAGRRVRLIVLPAKPEESGKDQESEEFSTANSLLKFAGTWAGDDLEELLQEVRDSRSQAKF